MKKILFDFLTLEDSYINGGALYVRTVFYNLIKEDVCLYGLCKNENKLSAEIKSIIQELQIPLIMLQGNFVQTVNAEKFDCFFVGIAQRYNIYDLSKINCKIIIVCHDIGDICRYKASIDRNYDMIYDFYKMRNKKFPKLRCYRNLMKRIAFDKSFLGITLKNDKMLNRFGYDNFSKLLQKDNVYLVTVSQYSKYAIEYYFNNISNEIQVFYPPVVERLNTAISKEIENLSDSNKYFLFVSADRQNKNYWIFEKAFDKFNAKMNSKFKAVVVGLPYREKSNFHFIERVNEMELEYLMSKAYCLVYASTSEGFGYPPIEAMKFGTPVIAAYDTSIPEVCGKDILYFNPIYREDLYFKELYLTENYDYYVELAKDISAKVIKKQTDDLRNLISYILR